MKTLIKHAQIVFADRIRPGDLLIENGVITRTEKGIDPSADYEIIDASGKHLIPGFIDIHNHGAAGFDFSFGQYNLRTGVFENEPEHLQSGIKASLDFYKKHGTTRVLLTTMAAPIETIKQSLIALNRFLQQNPEYRGIVAGVNLEGTFLVDPQFAGAQNPKFFYDLDMKTIDELLAVAKGLLKIVNIPPEHGEKAIPVIQHLTERGIVIAGGHTGAYADEFQHAIDAGLSLAVHFLNGPSRSHTKSFQGGGAVEAILRSDHVSCEIIGDGYHVGPDHIRDVLARKGAENVIMITDSMFANGLEGLSTFELFGLKGELSANGEYLQQVGKDSLFGSVLSPDTSFAKMLTWLTQDMKGVWHRHHPAMSLDDAIILGSQLFSTNPARLLGIDKASPNANATGSIKSGNAADLIVAEIKESDGEVSFEIDEVMISGKISLQ